MNETEFFRVHVRPRLERYGTYDRVENAVGTGMFDVNYAIEGTQGWLELKMVHSGGKIFFEKFQLPWLKRRARHTGNSGLWVLATDGKGAIWLYGPKTLLAAPRTPYKDWVILQQVDLSPTIYSGIKPWPWDAIKETLVDG
jgi:hypothetical protein